MICSFDQSAKGRIPKPWYRSQTGSWYVWLDGRQIPLGRTKPQANRKFNRLMVARGREDWRIRAQAQRGSRRKDPSLEMVYFVRDDESGDIKIGRSLDPLARLKQLQTGHSGRLVLLGAIAGEWDVEARLHYCLRMFRIRGEWFRGDPALVAEINKLLAEERAARTAGEGRGG